MESIWAALPDRRYQTPTAANADGRRCSAARDEPRACDVWTSESGDAGAATALVDSVSRFSRCRSVRISEACWYRRFRSFSSALLMISSSLGGTSGFSRTGGGRCSIQNGFEDHRRTFPRNGNVPVAISYSTAPKENRSVRASSSLPRACSGDIYATVPSVAPGLVRCCSSIVRVSVFADATWLDRTAGRRDLRQPEIKNFGMPALGDEDVRRLDVAMDDAFGVSGIQRIGNLDRQTRAAHPCPEGRPAMRCFSVVPSRNSMAMNDCSPFFADVVNRADVGMVESGSGTSFTAETFQCLRVSGNVVRQELQRDETT